MKAGRLFARLLVASIVGMGLFGGGAFAVTPAQDKPLSVQVSPSPLVATIKPGERTTLDLRIMNTSTVDASLAVGLSDFKANTDGSVQLMDNVPKDVSGWVTFADPVFTVKPGEWFTEHIRINAPKDIGFSYTFAITISKSKEATMIPGQQSLQGKVAVFTLLNVDKPGAKREFSIETFQSSKRLYEYLPASFSYRLTNVGNTIVQPVGNIFIQRSGSGHSIATLPLNEKGSYLLPGNGRTLTATWSDGFPRYQQQKVADNVPEKNVLAWDWGNAQKFRFGHYVAKMVAVYNDGQRDVPIEAEVGFWVVPWKLLAGVSAVLIILIVGLVVVIRKFIKLGRYAKGYHHQD